MKRSVLNISRVFLILGLSCISFNGNSQDLKMTKKEKKNAKEAETIKNFTELGVILERRKFVFEANRKQNGEGLIVTINPSSNYIKIDSVRIIMNLERFGDGWMPNVTLYGNAQTMGGIITHWELLKNSKKLYYYLMLRSIPDYPKPASPNFTIRIYADKSAMVRLNRGRKSDFNEFFGCLKAL